MLGLAKRVKARFLISSTSGSSSSLSSPLSLLLARPPPPLILSAYHPFDSKQRILVLTTFWLGWVGNVEVYGDPEVHPQHEEYWGHVNPIGPRACYDEGKRVAEVRFLFPPSFFLSSASSLSLFLVVR